MNITYDADADAAYITLGEKVGSGEAAQQVSLIDTPNGQTQVTIDFDAVGHILGFEFLAASLGLRREILEAASPMEASSRVDARRCALAAAERVEEETNAAWTAWRRGLEKVTEPVFPISHPYGHSDSGTEYAHDVLREVRPLRGESDSNVLILPVESWTHLEGWFGDAGNFEVWMRKSDLAERRFEQAWCMIRTDSGPRQPTTASQQYAPQARRCGA